MPTLRLITSSSQRRLIRALADTMRAAPLPPLVQETIVVLSPGMARWVSMELAALLGVSAGLQFTFPNDLLDRSFLSILDASPSSASFTRSSLTWRIAARLPSLAPEAGFEQIATYLGDGHDDRRLVQISRSIADLFDQYTIFRPEMVCGWDEGDSDDWQAQVWRAVTKECRGTHRAALLKTLNQRAAVNTRPTASLPRRVSLFGIAYLPPFHLEALRLLSSYCEVTCYLLNPCGQYWGTIISEKKKARLTLHAEAEAYYETGNPLLSSFGTLGQEFFESLLDHGFEAEELDNNSPERESGAETPLLSLVKNDILTLLDRPAEGEKVAIPADDRSIQIHSCHGPLREMEILYDTLLAQFDELPDLEPRHIVVMMPDIEAYAPYISSVFGPLSSGRPQLPFTIADRSMRTENPFIDAFLHLLALVPSRFAVNEIVDFLEIPAVSTRFAFDVEELSIVRTWLEDCNVRWGLDAGHRAELGFPGYDDFSWQSGLDKLFLGYAMAPDGTLSFNGILPSPSCSGSKAEALGKLAEYIAVIRDINTSLGSHHTLPEWADVLAAAASRTINSDESEPSGPLAVAKALNSLREACSLHGFTQPIALAAVRDHLTEILAKSGSGYGFLGGSITFCAMLPMRSIPMRVIWLAGMNDGQFPRTERPPGFSLMNGARRRGDRSLGDEDRYLFLEALMAAEDRFCISYTGQSDRDNSTLPPSVLVAELSDYISHGFVRPDGITPASILLRHRLQGFSPHYFDGHNTAHLFSYDRESCQALETRRNSGRSTRERIVEPLQLDASEILHIDLRILTRFLANPAALFLEQRLRVSPFNPAEEPDDSEPFAPDPLTRYTLSQELVSRQLAGSKYEECRTAARSRGMLPPLTAGDIAFNQAWESSSRFTGQLEPQLGSPLDALTVTFAHANVQLHAVVEDCRSGVHTRWRCARMKGKDRLTIWLEHLLLNIAVANGYPRRSMMIAADSVLDLPPLEDASATLSDLLELYREGMKRPLPFFPETSWLYLNGGQAKAEAAWNGDPWRGYGGERDNQAIQLCFGGEEPWGEEFRTVAERIYGPLMRILPK